MSNMTTGNSRICRMPRVRPIIRVPLGMGIRRASLPNLGSVVAPKRQLLRDGCGSLMSIYDEQSICSTDEELEFSDFSPEPTGTTGIVSPQYSHLARYPWYVGKMSRLEAEHRLEGMRNGTYLVRESEPRADYNHAIAIRCRNQPSHLRIYTRGGVYSLSHCHSHTFQTIEELIAFYQENSLAANFLIVRTTLLYPFNDELDRLEEFSAEDYAEELPEQFNDTDEPDSPGSPKLCIVDPEIPLLEQLWYHGKMCRSEAERTLATQPDFSFLLRDSESVPNSYSLSIRDATANCFIHLRIAQHGDGYILGQFSHPFRTVSHCIEFYCDKKLNVKDLAHRHLSYPVPRS